VQAPQQGDCALFWLTEEGSPSNMSLLTWRTEGACPPHPYLSTWHNEGGWPLLVGSFRRNATRGSPSSSLPFNTTRGWPLVGSFPPNATRVAGWPLLVPVLWYNTTKGRPLLVGDPTQWGGLAPPCPCLSTRHKEVGHWPWQEAGCREGGRTLYAHIYFSLYSYWLPYQKPNTRRGGILLVDFSVVKRGVWVLQVPSYFPINTTPWGGFAPSHQPLLPQENEGGSYQARLWVWMVKKSWWNSYMPRFAMALTCTCVWHHP